MITKSVLQAIDDSLKVEGNIDALIEDVCDEDNYLETSILVKLLLKGNLSFDKSTKYVGYGHTIYIYEYVSHSYLKNSVKVKQTNLKWDAEKEEFIEKDSYPTSMDIQMWEEYSSNRDNVIKEAIARIQKK